MSYEARPHNPNRNCVSRSGNASGFTPTDRHPSDRFDWSFALLIVVIVAAIVCVGLGVTVWHPEAIGGVR